MSDHPAALQKIISLHGLFDDEIADFSEYVVEAGCGDPRDHDGGWDFSGLEILYDEWREEYDPDGDK